MNLLPNGNYVSAEGDDGECFDVGIVYTKEEVIELLRHFTLSEENISEAKGNAFGASLGSFIGGSIGHTF
jgi:hypothetical protein